MAILEVKNLHKSFGNNHVLNGIGFHLDEGSVLSIIGSSGSGKTTLLRCINGLETATAGQIVVNGKTVFDSDITDKEALKELKSNQQNIGLVFQQFNLFPQYTALGNVTLAMKLAAKKRPDYKKNKKAILEEIDATAKKYLDKVGLSDKLGNYPCELSGGQQQRVSIGRALFTSPSIILADEPTGNLDSKNSSEIISLLRKSNRDFNQTMIVITHDENIALQCDRILTLSDGKIISDTLTYQG